MTQAASPAPGTLRRRWVVGAALVAIVLLAFELRWQAVSLSIVSHPIRGDAREYVMYAHNLETYGVYSRRFTWDEAEPRPPPPDGKRVPGYPLFLALFLDQPPRDENFRTILRAQAVLGTLTVVLTFLLARLLFAAPLALAAAALTAVSPHLVNVGIYLLSEWLLAVLLVGALYLFVVAAKRRAWPWWLASGAALAAAALAHPLVLYLVVPAGIWVALRPGGGDVRTPRWRAAAWVVLGFGLLYGPWVARNVVTLGATGDGALMRYALRAGAYPDMTYNGDPRTFAYPYQADPRFEETSKDVPTVMREIARTFREDPLGQLQWYLVGKLRLAWAWDTTESQGDVFIYPTPASPYQSVRHFRATHAAMAGLHGPLVLLMFLGAALAWWPPRQAAWPDEAVWGLRLLSLALLYHAAIMVAGFPLPRYSIALRPILYIVALLPIAALLKRLAARTVDAPR